MPHPDEGLIHAWLDGELDSAGAARVAELVARDPEWAAAAAEARGLIAASSRITGSLDRVPGRVIPRARPERRATRWWMMRAAALLVVVAGAVTVVRREPPDLQRAANTEPPLQTPKAKPAAAPAAKPAIAPLQIAKSRTTESSPAAPKAPAAPVRSPRNDTQDRLANARARLAEPPAESPRKEGAIIAGRAGSAIELKQQEGARAPISPLEVTVREADTPARGAPAMLRASIAAAPAPRCFKWRQPADSAPRILRISAAALADSVRLRVWVERGDSLLGASRRLVALALPCPEK